MQISHGYTASKSSKLLATGLFLFLTVLSLTHNQSRKGGNHRGTITWDLNRLDLRVPVSLKQSLILDKEFLIT